ncbi:MAG: ATP synthase F1 subunit delta [Myxococcaceae bacterium]
MANVSIARRYARALIDVAAEGNKLDRFGEQLQTFVSALQQSRELNDVMVNPAYGRTERHAIVDGVTKLLGGVDPEVVSFFRLLVDRNRMIFLPDIARMFRDLADARAGRIRGKVVSAVPLAPESLQKIADGLRGITERNVVLESKVDPQILGGISAQVGSVLYDGSLRTQLEEMRRKLTAR